MRAPRKNFNQRQIPSPQNLPMSSKPDFQIFTSLRWDAQLVGPTGSGFLNFEGHRERLLLAAQYFNESSDPAHFGGQWTQTINYLASEGPAFQQRSQAAVEAYQAGKAELAPLRVRISMGLEGAESYDIYMEPTPPYPLSQLLPELPLAPPTATAPSTEDIASGKVPYALVDTEATIQDAYTIFKTTKRQCYDAARARAQLKLGLSEVLLYDENGLITEGSTTNVHFWREGKWVSPMGGVKGTVKRKLLSSAAVAEHQIRVEDVNKDGEWVLLGNGVRGLWRAWLFPVGSKPPTLL